MIDVETKLEELLKEIRSIKRRAELPTLLTPQAAARELSISIWTLRDMIKDGGISARLIGKRQRIPLSEIERLADPAPKSRRGGGRPKTNRYDAREEARKLDELLAKKNPKR